MIAGLEEITGGSLEIDNQIVNDVVPAERGVAMVFQSYALYPHMTVFDNMAFGLRQSKVAAAEIETRVNAAAKSLQITDYLQRCQSTYLVVSDRGWQLDELLFVTRWSFCLMSLCQI